MSSLLLMAITVSTLAQQTQLFKNPIQYYRLGLEYFDKEKYSAAQKEFEQAKELAEYPKSETAVSAEYMAALCAIQLFHRDAALRLRSFIRNHPESPWIKDAHFQLGIYHYRKREFKDAVKWFEQVDPYELSNDDRYEYYFKMGYGLLRKKDYEKASRSFFEVKDVDNPYASPAKYYFAHIAYLGEKYETALKDFKKLEEHPKFGPIVPYYITQILYNQKKYDELLEYAPSLYEKVIEKRKPEVARLIGEAYYHKENYEAALPYLETYQEESRALNNDDRYQLGYTYYKTGGYEKASKLFSRLASLDDEMAQLAAYHLADCFMKMGEKVYARSAYKSAYKLEFDPVIQEDAMFNYAQLSYELSLDPYQKSIESFKEYIAKYPNSPRLDEAYRYLLAVYLTTKNFDAALSSIEKIDNKTPHLKAAYQKIAFNKATTLYQNRDYFNAIKYYDQSMQYKQDAKLSANALYWKAEAQYRLKQFAASRTTYNAYIFEPSAILTPYFNEANYNVGYTYFKENKYTESATWFRKFVYNTKGIDSLKMNDALLRIGDCYYVLKDYNQAIKFYDQAQELNKIETDYALFQKAVCLGINHDYKGKTGSLEKLVTDNPGSSYIDAAYYELGRTYNIMDQDLEALKRFKAVIDANSNNVYLKKSLISSGLIHYNRNENDQAIEIFTRIVNDYPTYEDTKEALSVLKSIYIERGQVDEYTNLVAGLSFIEVSHSELDSSVFDAARTKYFEAKCNDAVRSLNHYLEKFEPAIFKLKANYYLADCTEKLHHEDSAMQYFQVIATMPPNEYSELAFSKLSSYYVRQRDFMSAYSAFQDLEMAATSGRSLRTAIEGQMDCAMALDSIPLGSISGEKYLAQGFNEKGYVAMAKMFDAKLLMKNKRPLDALPLFQFVTDTVRTEIGAEAQYFIAEIHYENDSLQLAEKSVFALINRIPSYGYWVAKSLILLSDIYVAKEDYFQAKAALNSVIENYDGEELLTVAKANLAKVEALEKGSTEEEAAPEVEIEFEDFEMDQEEIDKLFNDEEEGENE